MVSTLSKTSLKGYLPPPDILFRWIRNHMDVADRHLLTDHVRYMGDEIAIVVGVNDLIVKKALSLIDVEYESYQPLVKNADVLAAEVEIHKGTKNIVKSHSFVAGGSLEEVKATCDHLLEGRYKTQIVQHCHLENHSAYAYMDDTERIVIVSSTQIPHIVRRIVAEALDMDIGHSTGCQAIYWRRFW